MKKLIKKLIGLIVLACVCVCGFYTAMGYAMYKTEIREESIEERIEKVREGENFTPLSSVPKIYKDAVIAVEDSRFYRHGGVDIVSLVRAFAVNFREKDCFFVPVSFCCACAADNSSGGWYLYRRAGGQLGGSTH